MNIQFVRLASNYFFYIILLATLLVLLISSFIGEKQDKQFIQDGIKLSQVEKYDSEGNLDKAEPLLAELVQKYPKSYLLLQKYAEIQVKKGNHQLAVSYFRKAQEEFPFIVKKTSYSLQMGESLYYIKEYNKAAKYLQIARLTNINIVEKQKIEQILTNITTEVAGD